jgi:hypothetical protein
MSKETKNLKFRRLAKNRGDIVVRYLRLLGNLSNRNNYEYSDEDVTKIFSVIEDELRFTKRKFVSKQRKEILF